MSANDRQLAPHNANENHRAPKTVLRRERAILALLGAKTVEQAAIEADMGPRTLERWLSEPTFQEQYRQAQSRMFDTALNVLRINCGRFADVVVKVATDESVPAMVRLAAASKGLDILARIHSHTDLERQLDELEQVVSKLELGQ